MEQQINLFQKDLEPPHVLLSLVHMLQLSGIFLGILLLVTGIMFYQHVDKQRRLEELAQKQKTLEQNLNQEQSRVPTEKDRERLVAELNQLEQSRDQRQKMFDTLSSLEVRTSKGFSRYFSALSKQINSGLWLTRFRFYGGGSLVSLEGVAEKGHYIPALIQRLSQEAAFKGKSFEAFRLKSDEEVGGTHFVLESEG